MMNFAAALEEDSQEDKRACLNRCILAALKRVAMKECWRLAIDQPCILHLEEAMPKYVKEAQEVSAIRFELSPFLCVCISSVFGGLILGGFWGSGSAR